MDNNDITLRTEIADMKTQLTDAQTILARSEGAMEQLNKAIAAGNRMTNWGMSIPVSNKRTNVSMT
jgi:hypothetical protein